MINSVAVAAAAAATLFAAVPVAAQTQTGTAATQQIRPEPVGEPTHHLLVSVEIAANAGDKWHVQGRLQVEDAEARLLVSERLRCDEDTGHEVRTSQNTYTGQERAILKARYIWTAPTDGHYVCEMHVRVAHPSAGSTPPADVLVRGPETRLSVRRAPEWAQHRFQGVERVVSRSRQWDLLGMYWTAPAGVASFDVTGDAELTNCYNDYHACSTSPGNGNASTIETRIQAKQIAVDGGYCRVTSAPFDRITVSWAVHHKKNNDRLIAIPVSTAAGCTRQFRLMVFARWVSGNPMLVEIRPWSNLYTHGGT